MSADLLATIVAASRRITAVREQREPIGALMARAEMAGAAAMPGRFEEALSQTDRLNVIAECKRRSPSRGVLRSVYDPVAIARGYAEAGAAALSVLTEPTFFDGTLEHLAAIRSTIDLPVLRKDFIVSEYQIVEAKAAGADAVLLIVAAVSPSDLRLLLASAFRWGLGALVEVHSAEELTIAVEAGARIIGVNNRNLRTLDVDVRTSDQLIEKMPRGIVAISESGLKTRADLDRLRHVGYRGFLIGEQFMTKIDPGAELRRLLNGTAVAVAGETRDASW